jgi:hypothetical protein
MTGNEGDFPSFPALSYESRGRHLETGICKLYVCFEQLVMTFLYRFPVAVHRAKECSQAPAIISFVQVIDKRVEIRAKIRSSGNG